MTDAAWLEKLKKALEKRMGKNQSALLYKKYLHAFPLSYQNDNSPLEAVNDILQIEKISADNPLLLSLYEQKNSSEKSSLFLKLLQFENPIPLSDVLPMLENMDLRTYSERPYEIKLAAKTIWISDFSISYPKNENLNIKSIENIFQESFIRISNGSFENDGFNKLILGAELSWREILILRAYAKYLHQIRFRFSQAYIEKTLSNYSDITKLLIRFFKVKFDPDTIKSSAKTLSDLETKIQDKLETVSSLDEDRILRHLWQLMKATLRTNYFQTDANGQAKPYLCFKFASKEILDLPLPHPLYEVFVYSPRFEAIHLRSAKVARGGIRWSDRREDFRTEVLGLMKAQKVKNAIIVPSGAKGGFVLKTVQTSREELQKEVIVCYKSFMRGLLDITDNLKNEKVIHPPRVVCYDGDDTYLVVAADKGTATFSDIANEIAKEYHFWLGDAFASGGSAGYDHKKMAITARGAWESAKRHFATLNINIQKRTFTMVGVGDMSGDVFGNGSLRSENTKLLAAFDHRHIFLDPNPDPKISFQERSRLFNLPRSSWEDYNPKLISKGGGVFSRTLKVIKISSEIKRVLSIDEDSLTPNELIRAILKAPVDLFFNGGIGTYVKASSENHIDVGDKTNEFCRINGNELRCKMVIEGGNLGCTQLGRIEYALQGGLINTDFIDNSGGVDCSDHEVNIKILLNEEIHKGKLTEKERNKILVSMTNAVADLVLKDNFNQALTLAFSTDHATKLMGLYHAYLKELETLGIINRAVEFLPDDKKILERKAASLGFTSPELAVLLAYAKIHIKSEILKSEAPEDPYLHQLLSASFPPILTKKFKKQMDEHPLRREIISTQISNQLVDDMGITFIYRMQTETGAPVGDIVKAFVVSSEIFKVPALKSLIASLNFICPAQVQYELFHKIRGLINLATRWFLQKNRLDGGLDQIIAHYSNRITSLEKIVPKMVLGTSKTYLESVGENTPDLAHMIKQKVAIARVLYLSLNIIEISTYYNFDLQTTTKVYFSVGGRFNLVWFRDQIVADNREGHWNTLSRLTLRDELDNLQKLLTVSIINHNKKEKNVKLLIESWIKEHQQAVTRWEKLVEMLNAAPSIEYSMFFITIRELASWVSGKEN